MKMNRDFKGIWIPKEIWLDSTMTTQEKLFYVEIDSLDMQNGCFASNSYFAEFFGISTTRVSIVIGNLIKKGYISSKIEYKEGTKQILKRVLNICYRPYLTKVKDPTQQKLKDNNTSNNTSNNINTERDEAFKKFYKEYPKSVGRGQALKTWCKLWKSKDLPEIETIVAYIKKKKATDWRDADKRFIPNPSTWLNSFGWEDEIITGQKVSEIPEGMTALEFYGSPI